MKLFARFQKRKSHSFKHIQRGHARRQTLSDYYLRVYAILKCESTTALQRIVQNPLQDENFHADIRNCPVFNVVAVADAAAALLCELLLVLFSFHSLFRYSLSVNFLDDKRTITYAPIGDDKNVLCVREEHVRA